MGNNQRKTKKRGFYQCLGESKMKKLFSVGLDLKKNIMHDGEGFNKNAISNIIQKLDDQEFPAELTMTVNNKDFEKILLTLNIFEQRPEDIEALSKFIIAEYNKHKDEFTHNNVNRGKNMRERMISSSFKNKSGPKY